MITCHIASIGERKESLRLVLNAVSPQVERVYVSLNNYDSVPTWLYQYGNVWHESLNNSLGDASKFLKVNAQDGICMFLDDDLIVPKTYVKDMLKGLKRYGGAVSLHGKIYNRPIVHFKKGFANYRCLNTVDHDVTGIEVLGTGCMIFDNQEVKISLEDFKFRNMADILFSKVLYERGIPMTVLKHRYGYLRYIPQKTTIWMQAKDCTIHTAILKSFLK